MEFNQRHSWRTRRSLTKFSVPAEAAVSDYIPAHAAVHTGWRRVAVLIPGPLWGVLPPRLAAALCNCPMCRGRS